jgi:hypothetical protein
MSTNEEGTPDGASDSGAANRFSDTPIPETENNLHGLERLSLRSLLVAVVLVVLADITLYSNWGFAGIGLFVLTAPWLLICGIRKWQPNVALFVMLIATLFAALRLVWQGSSGLSWIGFVLIAGAAMAMHGALPYLNDLLHFIAIAPINGLRMLARGRARSERKPGSTQPVQGLAIFLPFLATMIFASIFVMANPNLRTLFSDWTYWASSFVSDWLSQFSVWQAMFWIMVALLSLGFMFPTLRTYPIWSETPPAIAIASQPSSLYSPIRNMLVSVIVLFVVYLTYEFYTLWLREFPQGFYYAGYAHEGAAWLTVALALSTLVLSATFRDDILHDPRIANLRKLTWMWSALNLVLAIAVYNRLSIYIDFNGMTRMRTIGLFGVTCVLLGFIWVIVKVKSGRSFVWLVQRHLWTLALVVFAYLLTPVDTIVHAYNVRRILAGDLAPSVQITEHPISEEGILMLPPLLDSDNEIIREGIRALLAMRQELVDDTVAIQRSNGWVAYQGSSHLLKAHLDSLDSHWHQFKQDKVARDKAYADYKRYAFQWY